MQEIESHFVGLASATAKQGPSGRHPCQGIYYRPKGVMPKTAFIVNHCSLDFTEHFLAPYMAARGYGFLGWNNRYRGNERGFILEHALIDISRGVQYLKEDMGVEKVVLIGNSGGGALMAAYQSQAVDPVMRPTRGMELPAAVRDLIPADSYIALMAHPGRPEILTSWLDPSVIDEDDPASVNPELDMYNPENGPPYTPEFVEYYRKAQVDRNHRITDRVLDELERLGKKGFSDSLLLVHRSYADLRYLDGSLDPSDRELGKCYVGDSRQGNYSALGIAKVTGLRSWLSQWSLRESQLLAEPHLQKITVPSMVIQGTRDVGIFPGDAHRLHDALASEDKTLVFNGADHFCMRPGSREEIADCMAAWLQERGI